MGQFLQVRPLSGLSSLPITYLIVILLVVALALHPAMVIHGPALPEAATALRVPGGVVEIGLDSRGVMFLEDRAFGDVAGLTSGLQTLFAESPQRQRVIYLSADRAAPYANVLNVVDAASAAGVHRIELLAKCPGRRQSHLMGCSR